MPKKIIILDDDSAYINVVKRILATHGFDVIATSCPDTFLQITADTTVDLVMLDINMPHKDGFQILGEYKAAGGMSPVLFVTGYPSAFAQLDQKMCDHCHAHFAEGHVDILYKPFRINELTDKVTALIGHGGPLDAVSAN